MEMNIDSSTQSPLTICKIVVPLILLAWIAQASLLHPCFQGSAVARKARMALAPPLATATLYLPLHLRGALHVRWLYGISAQATHIACRMLELGFVVGPYWRIRWSADGRRLSAKQETDNGKTSSPDLDWTDKERLPSAMEILGFGANLCFSDTRGVSSDGAWNWASPPSVLPRPQCQPLLPFLLRQIISFVAVQYVHLAAVLVTHPARDQGRSIWTYYLSALPPAWFERLEPYIVAASYHAYVWASLEVMSYMTGVLLPVVVTAATQTLLPASIAPSAFHPESFFPLSRRPYLSESLDDFWTYRWHSLLRRTLIICGSKPAGAILNRFGGCTYHKVVGRMGAFAASGLMHEYMCLSVLGVDSSFRTARFFLLQGVGVNLELLFARVTGRRVGGPGGWLWTVAWLIVCSKPMVDSIMERGIYRDIRLYKDWTWHQFVIPLAPTLIV